MAEASKLYDRYTKWCDRQGIRNPMTQNKFGRQLTERGYQKGRGGGPGNPHIWKGIGLLHGEGANALRVIRDD